jgi:hypothetical protein
LAALDRRVNEIRHAIAFLEFEHGSVLRRQPAQIGLPVKADDEFFLSAIELEDASRRREGSITQLEFDERRVRLALNAETNDTAAVARHHRLGLGFRNFRIERQIVGFDADRVFLIGAEVGNKNFSVFSGFADQSVLTIDLDIGRTRVHDAKAAIDSTAEKQGAIRHHQGAVHADVCAG